MLVNFISLPEKAYGNQELLSLIFVADMALETVYALLQEILDAVVHEALDAGLLPHVRKMSHLLAPTAWGDVA